uniref:Small ribosomal subunit protein mS40 n=1 Tax=Pipistrellus kuhlii TaxID=59472 RepID=A0A7J7R571_PIPKU|nr:mitochondrial ribosomal protein S18B [Pipistrellus kuhlii]
MRMNPGNTWTQKNTRPAMVLALSGLTTAATTKAECPHRRLGRPALAFLSLQRKDKVAGNPCPICRDHKLHVDFRNVKLLQQFVCAHTGIIFHAPYTGVCMKQHKKLTQAIQKARDHGLLSYHIPQVEPRDLDFSNSHGAVNATPPAPTLVSGDPWYPWYSWKQPPERELSRLRRLYHGHLLEESGPPPESMPEAALAAGADTSSEPL